VALAVGPVSLTLPLIALYFSTRLYTVELRPSWLPGLLIIMAFFGSALVAHGIYTLGYRRNSN